MKRFSIDDIVTALVLVRVGQELGSDSAIAKAVHDLAVLAVTIWRL